MNEKIEFETLVALLDGELPPEEEASIRARLREDPQARRQLSLLQDGDRLARSALSRFPEGGPPQGARAAIGRFAVPATRVAGRWLGPALAASIALLAVGLPGSYYLGHQSARLEQLELAQIEAGDSKKLETTIDRALETLVSGASLPWTGGLEGAEGAVTPIRTFQNGDGRWCREYKARGPLGGKEIERRGVACRNQGGGWRTVVEILEDVALEEL